MQICFPITKDQGLDSDVNSHFGSAPMFLLYDTETSEHIVQTNENLNHAHGGCNPSIALGRKKVDTVVVGGIGARAIVKFNALGIKVYKSIGGSAQANIDAFQKQSLSELTSEHACGGHRQGEQHGGHGCC